MDSDHYLTKIPDYHFDVDRNKIRFNGIGPRLHDKTNEIWPRDSIDPSDECRKILGGSLITNINGLHDEAQLDQIKGIIQGTFEALKRCNINSVFNRFCKLDAGHFDCVNFSIQTALDAYTNYDKIIGFIHQVIRSINSYQLNNRLRDSFGGGDFTRILFGCNRNYDIFKCHIKWLVMANARMRKITIGHFVSFENYSMDLDKISWLSGLTPQLKGKIFIQLIYAVTRFVLELLRRYFYITVSNPYSDMLFYFRYDLWQKIHLSMIKMLDDEKIILPFAMDEGTLNLPSSAISKLKFFLKKDGLRPICTKPKNSRKNPMNSQLQAVLRHVLAESQHYQKFNLNHLLNGLKHFRQKIDSGHNIFFVRADVKNCFQSVQQDRLRVIINDSVRSMTKGHDIELFLLECLVTRRRPIRIFKWSLSPNSVVGNTRFTSITVISSVKISLQNFDNDYLRPHIINPILRESKDSKNGLYLIKGLRQGSSFSPLFCSIYIQEALNHYLREFFNTDECKIFRYVDDILFMTTDIERAKNYMHCMLSGFKDFNLRMNLEKLECNFDCEGIDAEICRLGKHIIFYKQRISLETLRCSYDYVYDGIDLHYTFPVSPYTSMKSIENLIKKSRIEMIHLDCQLNGFERILNNIFERALFFAHRAATTFLISLHLKNLANQDPESIILLARLTALRIFKTIKLGSETRNYIENDLIKVEILLLTSAAFQVTWNREQMRHRAIERAKIEIFARRSMMKYLASSHLKTRDVNQEFLPSSRRIQFKSVLDELVKSFPRSPFAEEVRLPKK